MREKRYLGDGLYAEYDGLGFKLSAQRGELGQEEHWVYLEPGVIDTFLAMIGKEWKVRITVAPLGKGDT